MPPPEPTVSPELVLIDPHLSGCAQEHPARTAPNLPLRVVLDDVRDTVLRMCELSDVNPPRRTRGARLLAFSGVATLWLEAALVATTQCGIGF